MKRQVDHRGRVSINLRLPVELIEELEAAADERAVGRSWLAERLLREGLGRLIPAAELTLTRRTLPRGPYRPGGSDDDEAGQGDGPGDQAGGDPVGGDAGEAEEAGDEHRDDGRDGDDPDDEARLPGDVGPAAGGSGHTPSIPARVVCEAHGIEDCPSCAHGGSFRSSAPTPIRSTALPPADPHHYRQGGWADGAVRPDWG